MAHCLPHAKNCKACWLGHALSHQSGPIGGCTNLAPDRMAPSVSVAARIDSVMVLAEAQCWWMHSPMVIPFNGNRLETIATVASHRQINLCTAITVESSQVRVISQSGSSHNCEWCQSFITPLFIKAHSWSLERNIVNDRTYVQPGHHCKPKWRGREREHIFWDGIRT